MCHMFDNHPSMAFKIESAKNGFEAFKKVQDALQKDPREFFDLVILDLSMPIMDGYEAAKKIKELYNKDCMFNADAHVDKTPLIVACSASELTKHMQR